MTLADSASYDPFAWVYNRHFGRYAEHVLSPLNELVLHDFPLNMEAGFRERWRGSFGIVEDDHVNVFRLRFDEREKRGEFAVTIFRHESGWSRSDFSLDQRCYSAEEITTALSAEGFSRVSIADAQQWLSLKIQIGRSFFLCYA